MTSEILNFVLSGGLMAAIAAIATLSSRIKEANAKAKQAEAEAQKMHAEAKTEELANVEQAIKIWREIATDVTKKHEDVSRKYEELGQQYAEMTRSMDALNKEVKRLTQASNKILKLLDRITPENMESTVKEIRQELEQN